MKEERYFYVPNAANCHELPQEEAVHAVRVLRLHEGDTINLMDGNGIFHLAEVTMTTGKKCEYRILDSRQQEPQWQGHIHIAMAPTKMMDRVEWMAEKATEIGVNEFSFLECTFSERRQMRADRIDKIVVAAMKQSHKAWKPIVNEIKTFQEFIKEKREGLKFICHCYEEIEKQELFPLLQAAASDIPITILIGPEGDFSIDEVRQAMDCGFQSVSLGKSRLRTETAALSAVMMAQLSK